MCLILSVVQEYIDKPLLLDGKKFDLRIYVLLLCADPLEIYVFAEGLVRLATNNYTVWDCICPGPGPRLCLDFA